MHVLSANGNTRDDELLITYNCHILDHKDFLLSSSILQSCFSQLFSGNRNKLNDMSASAHDDIWWKWVRSNVGEEQRGCSYYGTTF